MSDFTTSNFGARSENSAEDQDLGLIGMLNSILKSGYLKEFDGSGEPNEFIQSYETYCNSFRIKDLNKCSMIYQFLVGKAKNWHKATGIDCNDWNQYRDKFIRRFKNKKINPLAYIENIKQDLNEEIEDYIDRFRLNVKNYKIFMMDQYARRGMKQEFFLEQISLLNYFFKA